MEKEDFDSRSQYQSFYDEYHAVMDLPAKYFLEVIKCVFHDRALALGTMVVNEKSVDLGLISGIGLLTVEGQFDNTVGPGQTRAALELCSGIPDADKKNLVYPATHYSMIRGSTWIRLIADDVISFMREHE